GVVGGDLSFCPSEVAPKTLALTRQSAEARGDLALGDPVLDVEVQQPLLLPLDAPELARERLDARAEVDVVGAALGGPRLDARPEGRRVSERVGHGRPDLRLRDVRRDHRRAAPGRQGEAVVPVAAVAPAPVL